MPVSRAAPAPSGDGRPLLVAISLRADGLRALILAFSRSFDRLREGSDHAQSGAQCQSGTTGRRAGNAPRGGTSADLYAYAPQSWVGEWRLPARLETRRQNVSARLTGVLVELKVSAMATYLLLAG